MKNFPNQASDFARLRGTLETINDLGNQGVNVLDDEELGYTLARRRHYTFRGLDYSSPDVARQIEGRIIDEKGKAVEQSRRSN